MCILYVILIFVLSLYVIGDVFDGDGDVLGGTGEVGIVKLPAFAKDTFIQNHFCFHESKESLDLLSEVVFYVNTLYLCNRQN